MSGTSPLACALGLLRFREFVVSFVPSGTSSRFSASVVRAGLLGVVARSCVESGIALLGGKLKSAGVEEGKSRSLIASCADRKTARRRANDAI